MILIFGGAYQGKLEYAKDNFKIESIFDCRRGAATRGDATEPDAGEMAEPETGALVPASIGNATEPDAGETRKLVGEKATEPDAGEMAEPETGNLIPTGAGNATEPDLSADAICGLEAFVAACTQQGVEAADWFRDRREQWRDKILIMQDQSQGIVPVDAGERAAREMNGRLMIYLAGEAEEVHRIFCGIGRRIK